MEVFNFLLAIHEKLGPNWDVHVRLDTELKMLIVSLADDNAPEFGVVICPIPPSLPEHRIPEMVSGAVNAAKSNFAQMQAQGEVKH